MKHIGIIPDGARRWAVKNKLSDKKAYFTSMTLLSEFVSFLFSQSIPCISVYLCSRDNVLNRPRNNRDDFFSSQIFLLSDLLPHLMKQFNFQIVIAGDTSLVSDEYNNAISNLYNFSSKYSSQKLNLLIAYSSVEEIKQATTHSIENFQSYLWVKESLDIVIRSSVSGRLSDFLPLQSAYAELFFIDKFFNDITENDLVNILSEYKNRKRRYGK